VDVDAVKERYSLKLDAKALDNKEFLKELEEKADGLGAVVTPVSELEVVFEGEYGPIIKLIEWVLKGHRENVGYLKSEGP